MSAQTWTVDVQGKKHFISVEQDPKSGRATIRVDGRISVAPMGADEDEREVPAGSIRYVIRRHEGGKFDLDVPPEVFLNRMTAGSARDRNKGKSGIGKWIGIVVLVVVVLGLLRFGKVGLQYMRVNWQPYSAPDGSFKAKFPIQPSSSVESQNINGDMWTVNSLTAEYKSHGYAVQYVDLKIVVVESNTEKIMNEFFDGWMGAMRATVATKEKTSLARNPAISFVATIPAGVGSADAKLKIPAQMRGLVVLRDRRLFLVWTIAALGDPFSGDLRQFLDGFEITVPPERPAQLIAAAAQPEPEQQATKAEPPPADTRAEEAAEAQRREETAKRRAAEPQIYLEKEWKMYHVAGCGSVTPSMERVAIEQKPRDYQPHVCVPEDVRTWTWSRVNGASARP